MFQQKHISTTGAVFKGRPRRLRRSVQRPHTLAAWTAIASVLSALAYAPFAHAWDEAPLCAYDTVESTLSSASWTSLPWSQAEPPMCRVQDTVGAYASDRVAREARDRAEAAEGDLRAVHLRTIEAAHPTLADWVSVARGDAALESGDPQGAQAAYEEALESIDSDMRVRARVGRVIALARRDHRDTEESASTLFRRYPELPQRPWVELEVAAYNERKGDDADAAARYRRIDVMTPGSAAAPLARAALDAMRARGVAVRPMAPTERVERASRLFSRGPMESAREAIGQLVAEPPGQGVLRAKAYALAAKLARHEGRFTEAAHYFAISRRAGTFGDAEDIERRVERAEDMLRAATGSAAQGEATIARLQGRRPFRRIASPRLIQIAKIAARAGLTDPLNSAVSTLIGRQLTPRHRLDVVTHSLGIASDRRLLALLGQVGSEDDPGARNTSTGVKVRYYQARLLARLGRRAEATSAFGEVIARDRSELGWYRTWSRQHVAALATAPCSGVDCLVSPDADAEAAQEAAAAPAAETNALAPSADIAQEAPLIEDSAVETPEVHVADDPDLAELANRLTPLIEAHGEAYPWLARAQAFLRLHDTTEASRQLYESYLAWRAASGRAIRRCGLESVAMGRNRARRPMTFSLRQARNRLDESARAELATIAETIGAYGAATGFGGRAAIRARPRAYRPLVEAAAARYDLDPNLLFAVMRVESVYQEHIVSYAGAIGLAQIMPRTGTLIAHALGKEDFRTSDLLKPEVNLEFAAWYLRSLLDRWDGRLPLAIASYNGGPHNVRRWLRDYGEDLPMDAFLEHIPFEQTHRYVRRVLGHYEAYRAQEELAMVALPEDLPAPSVDPVGF